VGVNLAHHPARERRNTQIFTDKQFPKNGKNYTFCVCLDTYPCE